MQFFNPGSKYILLHYSMRMLTGKVCSSVRMNWMREGERQLCAPGSSTTLSSPDHTSTSTGTRKIFNRCTQFRQCIYRTSGSVQFLHKLSLIPTILFGVTCSMHNQRYTYAAKRFRKLDLGVTIIVRALFHHLAKPSDICCSISI